MLTDYALALFVCCFITIIFVGITFFFCFKNKMFISFECKYNMLQFGTRNSSIEVSKQKIHIAMSLYVYNKTYGKEIHSEATFSRANGFRVFWLVSAHPSSAEEIPELQ